MKEQIIKTGLVVPSKTRWSYTENQNEEARAIRTKFESALIANLGLPDSWNNYFQFRNTDDYVTLVDKGSYKNIVFRKMARNKEATYPASLKERLFDFIKRSDETNSKKQKEQNRREYFSEMIKPMQKQMVDDTQEFGYYHNGIEITINSGKRGEYGYNSKMGSCRIEHDGKITQPLLECFGFRNYTSIKQAQQWIDENQKHHDRLIALANEIKEKLPKEFFELETTTA
jgi:hypothetical protein